MSKTDVQMAIVKHLGWKSKLIDHLHGLSKLSRSSVPSHIDCQFGQWFYSEGKKEFGDTSLMIDIEREHKLIHDLIIAIVDTPHDQLKNEQIDEFNNKCDALIKKLEQLEGLC